MRLFRRGKTWYGQFYGPASERIQRSTRCHDYHAAERKVRDWERGANTASDPAATATMSDALCLMIESREAEARAGKLSESTVRFYKEKAGHILRVFEYPCGKCGRPVCAEHTSEKDAGKEHVPFLLRHLSPAHADNYISRRRKEGASDRTVYKELVALRVSLKLARRAQKWHGAPEAILPVGFKSDYKPRDRFHTPEELEKLLPELIPEHATRVAFIVATSANWHESELARREDVSKDFRTVLLRGTKTKTRFRTIPIVLPEHRSLLEYALRYAKEDGQLFAPWHNVNRDLVAACKRAGVPRCSPNDFRRTCATWLRASGLPPHLIAPVLGHVDSTMAEKVYARLTPEMLRMQMLAHLGRPDCSAGAADLQQIAALNAPIARFEAANALKSARPEGLEPPTFGFEVRRSIQLSYGRERIRATKRA